MLRVKISTTLQCTLGALITILLWLNASPAFGDLDASDSANGNYFFNANDPNPYNSHLYVFGGGSTQIIYQANAQQYVNAANTAVYISGGNSTFIIDTGAVIENAYQSVNGALSFSNVSASIDNNGSIIASGPYQGTGIRGDGSNTIGITNHPTGLISGVIHAVYGFSSLYNYGTLTGLVTGLDEDNLVAIYPGSVVNGEIILGGGTNTVRLQDGDDGIINYDIYSATTISKTGDNTWTLENSDSNPELYVHFQNFNIEAGTLVNNGRLAGTINVYNGATLKGTGLFQSGTGVTIQAGGTLAPGNSIGTMNIHTPLTFNSNSIFEVEIDETDVDKVVSSASVNLNGILHIIPLTTNVCTDEMEIISADGGVNGEFASLNVDVIDTATIDFITRYYDNRVTIQADVAQFEEKAHTPNQGRMGRTLDNLPGNMDDLGAAMRGIIGEDQLRQEMDRLMPLGAPIQTVFTNAQHFSTDTLQLARNAQQGNTRFAAAPGQSMLKQLNDDPYSLAQDGEQATEQAITTDGKLHFFASPFGQFGDIDSSDARTGYSYDAYGAIIGLDYNCIPNMSLGLSLGYISTDIGLDNSAGDSKVDTLRFGPYLTYTNGNWNVDASITGGFHWIDGNRNTIMGTAESDYNSYDFTIYGAASYDMLINNVTLSPTFSLTYVHQMTDDYAESGAGSANLTVEDLQTDSLQSLVGVHASMPVMLGNIALTPEAWIGWKYEWLDRDVDINSAFSANVTSPFTSSSQGTSRSQLVAGAAVFSQINETTSLKLNYELNTASDVTIHSVWAMIELNF